MDYFILVFMFLTDHGISSRLGQQFSWMEDLKFFAFQFSRIGPSLMTGHSGQPSASAMAHPDVRKLLPSKIYRYII